MQENKSGCFFLNTVYNRFDRIPACDGETDRWTDLFRLNEQYALCISSRAETPLVRMFAVADDIDERVCHRDALSIIQVGF